MPDFLFRPRCQKRAPSLSVIEQLAEDFRTTLTATALRYVAFCPERCAVVFSQDRCIRWYKPTADFAFHIPVHDTLDPYSLAVEFFDGKTIPDRMETVDASTWLRGRYRSNAMIKEESRSLPRYNAVLSLLWIHEEIEVLTQTTGTIRKLSLATGGGGDVNSVRACATQTVNSLLTTLHPWPARPLYAANRLLDLIPRARFPARQPQRVPISRAEFHW